MEDSTLISYLKIVIGLLVVLVMSQIYGIWTFKKVLFILNGSCL